MVPGFNTDFKYRGETYHVQTEDNGVNNPVVVTLLYFKGAILASRRTPYRELLGKPGFQKELLVLMKSQHKDLMRSLLSGTLDQGSAAPTQGVAADNPVPVALAAQSAPQASGTPPPAPAPTLDAAIIFYLREFAAKAAPSAVGLR